jgi:hypothetical protein
MLSSIRHCGRELHFKVSDDVWIWVHTSGSERCFDFCYVFPECSNSVVLLCCRSQCGYGTARMRLYGGF